MRKTLHELAVQAYQQANKVYEEAIESRAKMDELLNNVPLDDTELYKRVQETALEKVEQTISAAWRAKDEAEKLRMEIR